MKSNVDFFGLSKRETNDTPRQKALHISDGYHGGTEIDGDGYIQAYGYGTGIKDISFELTTARQGATSKPDYDYTNIGLLFPKDTATEIAYLNAQINHDVLLGGPMKPHIHWVQAQEALWKR